MHAGHRNGIAEIITRPGFNLNPFPLNLWSSALPIEQSEVCSAERALAKNCFAGKGKFGDRALTLYLSTSSLC